jgi:hypothetical protein
MAASLITNATAGDSFQRIEFVYATPVVLKAGTTYYLNLECEAPNGGRIYVETSNSSFYSAGEYYRGRSSSGEDAVFEVWAQ